MDLGVKQSRSVPRTEVRNKCSVGEESHIPSITWERLEKFENPTEVVDGVVFYNHFNSWVKGKFVCS